MDPLTDADLLAFLDEALPVDQMAMIETRCRDDQTLQKRLQVVQGREDVGLHTIGAIWRRHRLSCPDRKQLSQYLLGILEEEWAAYIRFHIDQIGCRFCQANLIDLENREKESPADFKKRRTHYFQTSAGYLPPAKE